MEKYKLSKNYVIAEYKDLIVEQSNNNNLVKYVIISKVTKRYFLINSSIRNFLLYFETPKSLDEVIELLLDDNLEDSDSVKTIESFFQSMVKKKIIVNEDENNFIVDEEPDINIPDGFELIEIYKKKNPLAICLAKKNSNNEKLVLKYLDKVNNNFPIRKSLIKQFEQEFSIMKEVQSHKNICNLLFWDQELLIAGLEHIEGLT
ncbi:MAG: hypothetical protein J4F36_13775 [Nitrosopumilaceae archaeon]|nr:hypothetical protein [Nitrosopumilaceae archaeon]